MKISMKSGIFYCGVAYLNIKHGPTVENYVTI